MDSSRVAARIDGSCVIFCRRRLGGEYERVAGRGAAPFTRVSQRGSDRSDDPRRCKLGPAWQKTEGFAKVVVCDAGPLIHLDELDCLDLLGDFPEVLVPEAVWREVLRHRPLALEKKTAVLVRVAPSPGQPAPLLRGLFETMSLHRGEQEALALATKMFCFSPTTRRQGWPDRRG